MSSYNADPAARPVSGWLILDKPRGLGSTQAVAAVKRNLREGGYAKTKVGHGGTLDPLAEGVLPIALGEATKLAGRMLDASKIYDFTIQFGEETDTLDTEGEVITRSNRRPPMAAIAAVLDHFTGEIAQVPPAYSAIKVDGKRAYDLARAGEKVEIKTRDVTIYALDMAGASDFGKGDASTSSARTEGHSGGFAQTEGHGFAQTVRPELVEGDDEHSACTSTGSVRTDSTLADQGADQGITSSFQTTAGRPDPYDVGAPLELAECVTLRAHVSKGTYIRSLARDIARALGTVGHVTYLRRIKAGPFDQTQAISLDNLNKIGKGAPLQDLLLPLEAGLDDIPALQLNSESAQAVRQGRVISDLPHTDGLHLAKLGDVPVALMELNGGTAKVVRGFNIPDVAE